MKRIHSAEELRQLLELAETAQPCQCSVGDCAGWSSLKEENWPAARMEAVVTLRDPDQYEPTFEERHPKGTRYESPDAPVAVQHFPYNRSDLWQCRTCHRHLLRYTEFGGYYVDHRVRELSPHLNLID